MKLKIAYIIPGLKYSGGIMHVLEEAREMKKKGHMVVIFSPAAEINRFSYFLDLASNFRFIPGVNSDLSYLPSLKHPGRFIFSLRSIKVMAGYLSRSLEPDINLVVGDWYWTILGALKARERNKANFKIVLKIQNPPQQELEKAVGWPFLNLCRAMVQRADALATVSAGAQKAIKDYFNCESTVVGNGIRELFFNEIDKVRKEELREQLNIGDRKGVLYAGRLNRQKGLEVLFEAMEQLKNKLKFILLMAGGGDSKYYESLAQKMGLDGYIQWLGDISPEKLPLIYQASDVFVFPSWFEGFGLPPLEAMASHVPVVLTETEGSKEYARPGINCLMVKPGDSTGLAKNIISVLEDAALGNSLGASGRKTAQEFSWKKVADRAETWYYQLIKKESGNYG